MIAANEKKLRHSEMRDKIYSYLLSTKEHPSAEIVYTKLKEDYPELSLGTVYRNLKQLEEIGKIVRVAVVKDKERYDAMCDEHVHFICTECGSVNDIEGVSIDALKSACDISPDFYVERFGIVLSGICNTCNNKEV